MRDIGKETHVHLIHLLFLFLFLPFPEDSYLLFVKMTSHFRYKIYNCGKGQDVQTDSPPREPQRRLD